MPTSKVITKVNWFYYSAPQRFYPLAGKLVPWFTAVGVLLAVYGMYLGLWVAPTDATQGQAYRIIFVHVPTAWMSMVIYVAMAGWAGAGLVFNSRLSSMMACALAPTGALMTVLALWTGALWGKPTWGAWWVWDARLTSELVLLFLYIGFMSLHASIDDVRRADRAAGLLALVSLAICMVSVGMLISETITARHYRNPDLLAWGVYSAQGKANICLSTLYDLRTNAPGYVPDYLEFSLDCQTSILWPETQNLKQTDSKACEREGLDEVRERLAAKHAEFGSWTVN